MPDREPSMRGRPRYGEPPKPRVIKFSMSLPPDLYERLERYCADEEREKAFAVRKALEPWLTERGY